MNRAKQRQRDAKAPAQATRASRRQSAGPDDLTPDSMLRLSELQKHVPKSRTTIYRDVAAGEFPRPKRIGQRATAWRWGDVLEWLRSREDASNEAARGAA